jgi:hypothetical protein
MYTYKDINGKVRKTRGTFVGWSDPTGPLNTRYAMFRTPATLIAVPRYLLTRETREAIAPYPA